MLDGNGLIGNSVSLLGPAPVPYNSRLPLVFGQVPRRIADGPVVGIVAANPQVPFRLYRPPSCGPKSTLSSLGLVIRLSIISDRGGRACGLAVSICRGAGTSFPGEPVPVVAWGERGTLFTTASLPGVMTQLPVELKHSTEVSKDPLRHGLELLGDVPRVV